MSKEEFLLLLSLCVHSDQSSLRTKNDNAFSWNSWPLDIQTFVWWITNNMFEFHDWVQIQFLTPSTIISNKLTSLIWNSRRHICNGIILNRSLFGSWHIIVVFLFIEHFETLFKLTKFLFITDGFRFNLGNLTDLVLSSPLIQHSVDIALHFVPLLLSQGLIRSLIGESDLLGLALSLTRCCFLLLQWTWQIDPWKVVVPFGHVECELKFKIWWQIHKVIQVIRSENSPHNWARTQHNWLYLVGDHIICLQEAWCLQGFMNIDANDAPFVLLKVQRQLNHESILRWDRLVEIWARNADSMRFLQ